MVNYRTSLETLYTDTCDVWEATNALDATTKRKVLTWAKVLENQPCRLSFDSSPKATDGTVAGIEQTITLFLDITPVIKPGSRIDVTRGGTMTTYESSGQPKRFNLTNHQEVELSLKDGEA